MRKQAGVESELQPARERILRAAMEMFMELGYAEASTLKIATRARVSKREVYALFGSKQAMLAACMADRVGRVVLPNELPPPRSHEELMTVLSILGATVLREVSDPAVMAVFRLAITEAQRAPEVASTLETARQLVRKSVQSVLEQAQVDGLIGAGDASQMSARYLALLWEDLMLSILLRTREIPGTAEIERRARKAGEDLSRLYAKPPARLAAVKVRKHSRR